MSLEELYEAETEKAKTDFAIIALILKKALQAEEKLINLKLRQKKLSLLRMICKKQPPVFKITMMFCRRVNIDDNKQSLIQRPSTSERKLYSLHHYHDDNKNATEEYIDIEESDSSDENQRRTKRRVSQCT